MNIDDFIKRAKEKAEEYKYRASFFESSNPMNTACIKVAKDHEQLAEWLEKSKEYQQYSSSMMNFDELSGYEVEVVGNKFDYKFNEGGISQ